MLNLVGEYECKLDAKSRLLFPASLKKQIPSVGGEFRFVLSRGFEQCLVLYTAEDWKTRSEEVTRLNDFVSKNREFIRYFHRGATELELDGANRLLLPKSLLEYAEIEKDMVLSAFSNRIEIWESKRYKTLFTITPEDYSKLAEEVMGKKENNRTEDVS
ncbi:MAG: division/cell wall cluster transcriptional repressor MraZ [Bacteroidota bacterium]